MSHRPDVLQAEFRLEDTDSPGAQPSYGRPVMVADEPTPQAKPRPQGPAEAPGISSHSSSTERISHQAGGRPGLAAVPVENLSFTLPRGGIVGILGPNGVGKTTLFR